MLDIIIIILTILSVVIQLVVSIGIIYHKSKCKNNELHMVTNLWYDYIPHLLLIFSLLFIIYSIKYSDTSVLLTVICLTFATILNIQILIYSKKSLTLITFPFQREEYDSFIIQDKCIIVENVKRKKLIHLSATKIDKISKTTK